MTLDALKQKWIELNLEGSNSTKDLESISKIMQVDVLRPMRDLIKSASPQDKRSVGMQVGELEKSILAEFKEKQLNIKNIEERQFLTDDRIDITLPIENVDKIKNLHPTTRGFREIYKLLSSLGYHYKQSSLIETDFYNFEALNFSKSHPARSMHDTFFVAPVDNLQERRVLRTHTSSTQIHIMQQLDDKQKKQLYSGSHSLKIFAPGATFRNESDSTHSPMFNQVEGLVLGVDINLYSLKLAVKQFIHGFFQNDDIKFRFRASYFPFTSPSFEVDINATPKDGSWNFDIEDNWFEILGMGMVHPNVIKNAGLDPEKVKGFAFGMGIERLMMIKYNITDIRELFRPSQNFNGNFGSYPVNLDRRKRCRS
ncbi:MAG: phenylalanine--tRNA ligase subunit alpha [Alphaproteobacteria bacterium]|nr:phenylalanine--tRNA ligase subunit alpha [Alphaproteobacteria bacterium]MBL0718024.1 phenylalanine--tRNA ligase subunit alpha [Alphaproteobacteria bacterium]